jgi:hypothetical protein
MTQFSRIDTALKILVAMVADGHYFRATDHDSNTSNMKRAKWAFEQADAFIEEAKNQGEDI